MTAELLLSLLQHIQYDGHKDRARLRRALMLMEMS